MRTTRMLKNMNATLIVAFHLESILVKKYIQSKDTHARIHTLKNKIRANDAEWINHKPRKWREVIA